jgi:hypothetical protein
MFGWFREAERTSRGMSFSRGAEDVHAIYGWFQIEDVLSLGNQPDKSAHPAWTHYHPHFNGIRDANNVLYVAAPTLILDGIDTGLPGAGRIDKFRDELCLTAKGANRSTLQLPEWFDPTRASEPLSYHAAPWRWTRITGGHRLESGSCPMAWCMS